MLYLTLIAALASSDLGGVEQTGIYNFSIKGKTKKQKNKKRLSSQITQPSRADVNKYSVFYDLNTVQLMSSKLCAKGTPKI